MAKLSEENVSELLSELVTYFLEIPDKLCNK